MRRIFALFVFMMIIIAGCKTNPPNSPEEIYEYGQVAVTTNVPYAEIYVDDISSGLIAPDTLSLTVGEHVISLVKIGFEGTPVTVNVEKDVLKELEITMSETSIGKIVLLEDFANVSCFPCVQSNLLIESLVEGEYKDRMIVVKFPTDFPGPSDPFFLANEEECSARISYYNVFFAPTLIVDGIKKPISSDSNAVKNDINERLLQDAHFELQVTSLINGDELSATVSLKPVKLSGISTDNLFLHTIIIEKEIHFNEPPGANEEKDFYHVMRKMLPSSEGTELTALTLGETKEFNMSYSLAGKTWDRSKLAVVAFVQDKLTKEVFQAAKSE